MEGGTIINIGTQNELRAATYYAKLGYEIFIPVDSSRIDFIAHHPDGYQKKVQVKTLSTRRYKGSTYTLADLATCRNGKKTPYTPGEIDEFFIAGDQCYLIPNLQVYPARTVMLTSTDSKYRPRHNWNVKTWEVEA